MVARHLGVESQPAAAVCSHDLRTPRRANRNESPRLCVNTAGVAPRHACPRFVSSIPDGNAATPSRDRSSVSFGGSLCRRSTPGQSLMRHTFKRSVPWWIEEPRIAACDPSMRVAGTARPTWRLSTVCAAPPVPDVLLAPDEEGDAVLSPPGGHAGRASIRTRRGACSGPVHDGQPFSGCGRCNLSSVLDGTRVSRSRPYRHRSYRPRRTGRPVAYLLAC